MARNNSSTPSLINSDSTTSSSSELPPPPRPPRDLGPSSPQGKERELSFHSRSIYSSYGYPPSPTFNAVFSGVWEDVRILRRMLRFVKWRDFVSLSHTRRSFRNLFSNQQTRDVILASYVPGYAEDGRRNAYEGENVGVSFADLEALRALPTFPPLTRVTYPLQKRPCVKSLYTHILNARSAFLHSLKLVTKFPPISFCITKPSSISPRFIRDLCFSSVSKRHVSNLHSVMTTTASYGAVPRLHSKSSFSLEC